MQSSDWSSASTEARNQYMDSNDKAFRPNFTQSMSDNMGMPSGVGQQGSMPSLYRQPTQEEISAVLSQYAPNSGNNFRQQSFSHAMQSHPSAGQGTLPGNNQNLETSPTTRNAPPFLDPAASAAAAAAYGHNAYSQPGSTSASRRSSQKDVDGSGNQLNGTIANGSSVPGGHQNYNAQMAGSLGMQNPNMNFPIGAGLEGYHPGNPMNISPDDFRAAKKRRMTYAGQIPGMPEGNGNGQQGDSNSNAINQQNKMGSMPIQDLPQNAARPPFRHRRSRSGSELAGNLPGYRSSDSFYDGLPVSQSYPAGAVPANAPPMFVQQSPHDFNRSTPLPPSALGGHAASHPPGLGSQILRGVDVSASGSSAASDFTKRKGWTGRVVEELLDFVHVLDPEGIVLFASPSVYGLTGWTGDELRGHKLTEFIHPQDVASFERELERMSSGGGDLLTYYRFKTKPKSKKGDKDNDSSAGDSSEDQQSQRKEDSEHSQAFTRDGDYVVFEASGHPYFPPKPLFPSSGDANEASNDKTDEPNKESKNQAKADGQTIKSDPSPPSGSKQGPHPLRQSSSLDTPSEVSSQSHGPLQCFFCSARPYPSKNTSMLDSFLELKLENEKLRLMIADMDITGPDNDGDKAQFAHAYHPDLLKQELEGDVGSSMIHSMFGGSGMQGEGRFSHGGSVRADSLGSHPTSPTTVRGGYRSDLGTGLAGDESDTEATNAATSTTAPAAATGATDEARRKKKPKQDDGDHVCTDCGRVDSPEWRKGPLGPKTLCNACGLRWAKKIKRKGGDPNMAAAGLLAQQGAAAAPAHMMAHGNHAFGRPNEAQMQPMGMRGPPPGSINAMPVGMSQPVMMPNAPAYANQRASFDDGKGHRPGQHMPPGSGM